MAFREKSALIMTLALLVGMICYYWQVNWLSHHAGQLIPPNIPTLITSVAILVFIAIAGHIVIAITNPKDANSAADERDYQIAQRASSWADAVMGVGTLASLGFYLLHGSGDLLFYTVFASVMVSQLMDYVFQIILFRTR